MAGQGGYSAHLNTIIVDGVIVTGFGPDDFFEADHDSDDTTAVEGADSYVATSDRPAERLGHFNITVMQTSLANNLLATLLANKRIVTIQSYNARGGEMAVMARGRLKKSPPINGAKDAKPRTWEFIGKLRKAHAGYEE